MSKIGESCVPCLLFEKRNWVVDTADNGKNERWEFDVDYQTTNKSCCQKDLGEDEMVLFCTKKMRESLWRVVGWAALKKRMRRLNF